MAIDHTLGMIFLSIGGICAVGVIFSLIAGRVMYGGREDWTRHIVIFSTMGVVNFFLAGVCLFGLIPSWM